MEDTFISRRGIKVTVNIPDRTPEEQAKRDREIKRSLIALYKSIQREEATGGTK